MNKDPPHAEYLIHQAPCYYNAVFFFSGGTASVTGPVQKCCVACIGFVQRVGALNCKRMF